MSAPVLAPVQAPPQLEAPTQRLLSLDALRGFDMFWIVGGDALFQALYKACPIKPFHFLYAQLDHKAWAGVACYDLIFPLFVFMVGISLVFSLTRTIDQHGKATALKRILFRSLILYALGVFQYGGIAEGMGHVRWMGVLQRLAICYLCAGVIFCNFRVRGMIALICSLLLGYCALLTFTPIRDFNLETEHLKTLNLAPKSPETATAFYATTTKVSGRFEDGLNLTQQIDFQYLPGRKWDGAYDPEGILSTLPAIATCLLGVFAGLLLRNPLVPDQKKVIYLVGAGVAGVFLGFLWGLQFPVIKKIWTSSYVLVAGGYAAMLLGAFYQIIEIWRFRSWCTPFVWIGMNPITIYIVFHLVKFDGFAERIVGGPVAAALGNWGEFLVQVVVIGMVFAFVRFLHQRKLFLRF